MRMPCLSSDRGRAADPGWGHRLPALEPRNRVATQRIDRTAKTPEPHLHLRKLQVRACGALHLCHLHPSSNCAALAHHESPSACPHALQTTASAIQKTRDHARGQRGTARPALRQPFWPGGLIRRYSINHGDQVRCHRTGVLGTLVPKVPAPSRAAALRLGTLFLLPRLVACNSLADRLSTEE